MEIPGMAVSTQPGIALESGFLGRGGPSQADPLSKTSLLVKLRPLPPKTCSTPQEIRPEPSSLMGLWLNPQTTQW